MKTRPEILAPAGSLDSLYAAVRCGADAVYLGTQDFNARRNAANFDYEALKKAVRYCHIRGVKVYVTMNTLITDREIEKAAEAVRNIAIAGADALIIQDLAVAVLTKRICPEMELHASTQMSVTNINGVNALKDLGFKRVVLARELSFEEIKEIVQNTDLEIEVFVHGALCSSVSGMCYLSSVIGQRSGNRGLCAQPCRLDFKLGNIDHALSLKDMSYLEYLSSLADIGVRSFKIEGRMKRPEYVAAAVSECVKALDGKVPDMDILKNTFSRSGFTDGYLKAKRDINMHGIRSKEDVVSFEKVKSRLHCLYCKDVPSIQTYGRLFIKNNEPCRYVFSDGINDVDVTADVPEQAQSRPLEKEFVHSFFKKLGSTPYILKGFECEIDEGTYLTISQMNSIKKKAAELLSEKRALDPYKEINNAPSSLDELPDHKSVSARYVLKFSKADQFFGACENVKYCIFPLSELLKKPPFIDICSEQTVGALSAVTFQSDLIETEEALKRLKGYGLKTVYVNTLCDLYTAKKYGFEVIGGYGLNITNSVSLDAYRKMGVSDAFVSFELNAGAIRDLKGSAVRGIISYGYLPLMRFRRCPARNNGCGKCSGINTVSDEKKNSFTLLCDNKKFSTLYNCLPLYAFDKEIPGADLEMLEYSFESKELSKAVFENAEKRETPNFAKTNGLYNRKLL